MGKGGERGYRFVEHDFAGCMVVFLKSGVTLASAVYYSSGLLFFVSYGVCGLLLFSYFICFLVQLL